MGSADGPAVIVSGPGSADPLNPDGDQTDRVWLGNGNRELEACSAEDLRSPVADRSAMGGHQVSRHRQSDDPPAEDTGPDQVLCESGTPLGHPCRRDHHQTRSNGGERIDDTRQCFVRERSAGYECGAERNARDGRQDRPGASCSNPARSDCGLRRDWFPCTYEQQDRQVERQSRAVARCFGPATTCRSAPDAPRVVPPRARW